MTADLAQQIARMAFAFDVSDERRQKVHAMARTARDMIDASNASIRKIAALEAENARLSAEGEVSDERPRNTWFGEMSDADVAEIEAAAMGAASGQWYCFVDDDYNDTTIVLRMGSDVASHVSDVNAKYLAKAYPDAALALIARMRTAEAENARLSAELRDMTDRYHEVSGEVGVLHDRINHLPAYETPDVRQLRAENARLSAELSDYTRTVARLQSSTPEALANTRAYMDAQDQKIARLSAELERARPVLEAACDYVKRMGGGSNFYALLSAVKTYDAAPVAEQLRELTDAMVADRPRGIITREQALELLDAPYDGPMSPAGRIAVIGELLCQTDEDKPVYDERTVTFDKPSYVVKVTLPESYESVVADGKEGK